MARTPASRVRKGLFYGKIWVDALTFDAALAAFEALVLAKRGGRVYTPNVDHVVLAEHDARFAEAYARVDLSFADGMPLVALSRLRSVRLPEKVSGSDFVLPLMEKAALHGWRVYLLGGMDGVADAAAKRLLEQYPTLQIVGRDPAHIDLAASPAQRAAEIARIAETRPDIVLVALGAPKQEIWIDDVATPLAPAVLIGVGASLDFLAGTAVRAPRWMSRAGLEWLHRLGNDPKRMIQRYLVRDAEFPAILARQFIREHPFRPLRKHPKGKKS
jgi:N-acetylglucosaminyldiphosphoundecaprenol N-acetyl-beta-D-mannosaminyltransferase